MREIVLDTETTGLNPKEGHRLIEIGCVELLNVIPTGRTYQVYLNPDREVPAEATAISGITTAFLQDKARFVDIVNDFLDFIGQDSLVIHNASFDLSFLNAELARVNRPLIPFRQAIDTVQLAKRAFPGAPASLDALCRRFKIDLTRRTHHGALLDAQLLAKVYLELKGGRQRTLPLQQKASEKHFKKSLQPLSSIVVEPSETELALHLSLVESLTNPLWKTQ